MSIIGIDFGATNSSASWINPVTGLPEVINFHETGLSKIPSVVFFPLAGEPIVGDGPFRQLENAYGDSRAEIMSSTVTSIKRVMDKDAVIYTASGKTYNHSQVISFILKKIKEEAYKSCAFAEPITDVVLTHPVVFAEWQKDLLREAVKLAGFKKVKFLEEPISAAIGVIKGNIAPASKGLLIYDFGGGTFDVAYVKVEKDGNIHSPILPEGDQNCGGDDLDRILYEDWEQLVKAKYDRFISPKRGRVDLGFIAQCRKEKELLSTMPSIMANEMLPYISKLETIQRTLTRNEFNQLIAPIINKTIDKTKLILDKIKSNNYPLDSVVLIGGSSRIPLVQEKLKKILPNGVNILSTGAVDTAVALGAICSILQKPKLVVEEHHCIYCGKKNPDSNKFCQWCGKENYSYQK